MGNWSKVHGKDVKKEAKNKPFCSWYQKLAPMLLAHLDLSYEVTLLSMPLNRATLLNKQCLILQLSTIEVNVAEQKHKDNNDNLKNRSSRSFSFN